MLADVWGAEIEMETESTDDRALHSNTRRLLKIKYLDIPHSFWTSGELGYMLRL